ncbi:HNH endonuclease [Paenibacillus sp. IITD108]|uniref:HNH endonuclease n=1 Tax=Paenibacillus sp. IITD108 TaxID=3116649 RepID=UPI002F4145D8
MSSIKGSGSNEITRFISNLSQIIYDRKEFHADINEEEFEHHDTLEEDKIAELVMFRVETIILPRNEAVDIYNKSKGNISFSNLWNVHFSEALKQEVRERDGHKCVVCESDIDLHVHHKIPRDFGGVHHRDNLVTLCSSCHPAIETGDVAKAHSKCLFNFRKTKAMKRVNLDLPLDKIKLKAQVDQKLEYLLTELSKKNEDNLSGVVVEIMSRLELLLDRNFKFKKKLSIGR